MTSPPSTTETNRKPGRFRQNLAVLAGATVAALLLAEILFRLLGIGGPPVYMTQDSAEVFVRSDVEGLAYELRPNFAGRTFGCDVRINSHGMRSPERPLKKPAGTKRVLILGDSVAFGQGVEQAAIFSARLETLLAADAGQKTRIEVLNAAVPGYNAAQLRLYLQHKGFAHQPDLVLVAAGINDVEAAYVLLDNGGLQWENPPPIYQEALERDFLMLGVGGFLRRHVRVVNVLDRAFRGPYLLTRKYLDYLDGLYTPTAPGWREAQEALVAMRVMCKARGAGFLLVYCPVVAQPEPAVFRRIRGEWAALANREEMAFFDLYDAEKAHRARDLVLSPLDRHPSAFGHKVIAEAVAPAVARELSHPRAALVPPTPETLQK